MSLSELRAALPVYAISKNKMPLGDADPDALFLRLAERHQDADISTIDGVKIDLEEGWVHLRKSNTEPILRVYAEAPSTEAADTLAGRFIEELHDLANS